MTTFQPKERTELFALGEKLKPQIKAFLLHYKPNDIRKAKFNTIYQTISIMNQPNSNFWKTLKRRR
jgi:hypothetical protein